MLEGVKRRCSGLGVNEYGKGREEAEDLVEREPAFLDGVDWMGFAGTKVEELGEGQVYPGRGVEGVASATSKGEDTYTPGPMAYKGNTR